MKAYFMQYQQYLTLDEGYHSNCLNYKTDDMFRTCDEDFVMGKLMAMGWKQIVPIWAMGNKTALKMDPDSLPQISSSYLRPTSGVHDLMYGIEQGCLVPCLKTTISKKLMIKLRTPGSSSISFEFPSKVDRKEEEFISLDFNVLLSLTGGNLGLWLGVSILSILNHFLANIKILFKKFN